MHPSRLSAAGGLLALVGLVLLVIEVARTLASNPLGTLGTVLLWVGVGLLAAGGLLLTFAVARDVERIDPTDPADPAEPAAPAESATA
jgi:hypothetical protein